MQRKYREIKAWRDVRFARSPKHCAQCLKAIDTGTKYERRVYEETSETGNTLTIVVMLEHLNPGCNQYEI